MDTKTKTYTMENQNKFNCVIIKEEPSYYSNPDDDPEFYQAAIHATKLVEVRMGQCGDQVQEQEDSEESDSMDFWNEAKFALDRVERKTSIGSQCR